MPYQNAIQIVQNATIIHRNLLDNIKKNKI